MKIDRDVLLVGLRKVGAPGLAALGILAGSAWAEWVSAPAILGDTVALREQALAERDRKAAVRPVDSVQDAMAAIRLRLPDDRQSNATLAALLQDAKTRGLAVGAVQFRTEPSGLPGVIRHRLQLPIKGTYDEVRAWISTTLRDRPGVSLDSLEIARKDAVSGDLQVQATLSLWADMLRPLPPASVVHHAD